MKKIEQSFKKERMRLFGFIRSKINSNEDAEDVLQDVFLQAIKTMSIIEPINNLMSWLYTVAHNRIIDWYRRKREPSVSLSDQDMQLFDSLILDSGINIEKEFIRNLVIEALEEAIDELPEAQKDVFISQAIEGRTFKKISEYSGIPINTLIARKRYAIRFLQTRLAEMKVLLAEIE